MGSDLAFMAGYGPAANNNNYVLGANRKETRIPDGWEKYDEVSMTAFGPIGIKHGEGFVYLDEMNNDFTKEGE
jgi:hypothetical protein